ncbi:MAG: 7-cyano-7-deazaguanine synthase QueC [Candidatus Methanospirareceae archaeon]
MTRTKIAVCVCSGGIDSTVAATIASYEGYELHFIHASYGQRAEAREKEVVEKIARYLGAKELKFAEIPFLKELGGSALTDLKRAVPVGEEVNLDLDTETPSTWVPCRNLILLAHASAYAEVIGAEALFVGFNAEEARSYPDNDVEFVNRYNEVLEKAVASFSQPPVVKAPLVNLLKPAIIRKGVEVEAPLHLTYSCYLGGEKHCGICESCLHRRRGFKDAGVEDPTEYMC